MDHLTIAEIPSGIWNFHPYFSFPIDRTNKTVAEYLEEKNIYWRFGDDKSADLRVYKEENLQNGLLSFRRIKNEYQKKFENIPYINLNGEAQENSRISYLLADPDRTFSVAPGNKFKRLFFPSVWSDPQLEGWDERLDRICWIGRPLPERIRLAKKVNKMGIGLDIYSKEPWPLPNWRGFTENEIATSMNYKYRIVYENSLKNLYHSEKLFSSIRSGCISFYISDPALKLPPLDGVCVPCNETTILNRDEYTKTLIENINRFMFTNIWEFYSFKSFFDRIINFGLKYLDSTS
jgi:hypothetical protein